MGRAGIISKEKIPTGMGLSSTQTRKEQWVIMTGVRPL